MHEAIEGLQGVEVIADDILVCGFGKCCELNLTLNLQRINFRLSWAPFMGHLFTADGFMTDSNKFRAIRDMSAQTEVKSMKKLLVWLLTYNIATFLSNLSSLCELLRELKPKDAAWCWLPVNAVKLSNLSRLLFVRLQCWRFMMLIGRSKIFIKVTHHLSVDLAPP